MFTLWWVYHCERTLCTIPAKHIALKPLYVLQNLESFMNIYMNIWIFSTHSFKHSFRCNFFSDFSQKSEHLCSTNDNSPLGTSRKWDWQQGQDAEIRLSDGIKSWTEHNKHYENESKKKCYEANNKGFGWRFWATVSLKPLTSTSGNS